MKRFFILILIYIVCVTSYAGSIQKDTLQLNITVRGIVLEQQTKETLPGATVQLLDKDNKIVKSVTTTLDGVYLFKDIPKADYRVKVSYMGYESQERTLDLPHKSGVFKVADIYLREQSQWLKEAVVTAKAPEVTVVEDTTMFQAKAYRVPEGSVVEELLKKIPGVEIDEGKITINGKEVSQILVDGKEFFGDDKEITLKNLPADIIDKIKAYEKKSDDARITGVDDGNEKTVLDLSIKKDKKKGWFGNVDAGYGTHNRYSGRVNVNRFTSDKRYTLIGEANNTRGNGQNSTQSGGFNFNVNKEKLESNGNVRLNTSQRDGRSWGSSQSFENKDAAYSNWQSFNKRRTLGVNMDYKMEWRPDTMTTIMFRPNFSYNQNYARSENESASFNSDPYAVNGVSDPLAQLDLLKHDIGVNHNLRASHNERHSMSGNASLLYNRRFARKGRNIAINLGGGFGNNDNESNSYSQIDYYQILAATGEDSVYHKIQFNDSPSRNHRMDFSVSYNEPLNDSTFLQISYRLNYRFQNSDRTVSSLFDPWIDEWGITYDDYEKGLAYAVPDIEQSRYVQNKYMNHDIRLQIRLNRMKYMLTAGVNVQPQTSIVEYAKGKNDYDIHRTVCNMAPTVNFRYRFSRQEQLRFVYRGNTGQPNITDLIPDTLDNANPLNIRLGNAELKPSFTHNLRADYNKFIQEHQRSYAVSLDFKSTQNAVSSRSEYDDVTGGRITKPENINGNWNLSGDFNFNTAFPDDRFHINLYTRGNYTNAVGFVYQRDEQQTIKNTTGSMSLRENIRGSFRNDWLDVSLFCAVNYNHSRSSSTSASNLDTYHYNFGGSTQIEIPWEMNLSTDVTNNSRRGYSEASMNTDELIWNMHVAKRFLKGNAATLRFSWYDILNKRSNVRRQINAFFRTDSSSESIYSYCMLHFIYRFNMFGGKPASESSKSRNRKTRSSRPGVI